MINPWDGKDWAKPKYSNEARIDFSECPLALRYPRRKLWHEAASLQAHRANRKPAEGVNPAGKLYRFAG